MQFIDNVTPQSGREYWWQFEAVPDKKFWTKRDEQTTRDYMALYYQNAYNTALLNYQNEYNSPLQQMLRYQDAGLNPFLAQNNPGNMDSAPSGASPRGSSAVTPSATEIAGSITSGVNSVANVLRTAQGIYDYVKFGRPLQEINVDTAGIQQNIAGLNEQIAGYNVDAARSAATIKDAEAAWYEYWNLGRNLPGENIAGSPRGLYMEQSTQRISSQISQLEALVDVLYPSQAERNRAGTALALLQKEVLDGQKGAILNINTGNDTADAILKMVCFWLLNK